MYSDQDLACNGNGSVWESEVTYIVSVVVPFWGYLLGSLILI